MMVMDAGSCRLKLGVGMDTVVFLSPLRLRQPSSSSGCRLRLGVVSRSGSAAAANNPRRFKQKQQRSVIVGNPNSNSSSSSTTRPAARPWPSTSASASTARTTPAVAEPQKEKDLVFVAGATGRVGSRAVRELIKLGFRVRAAVRNAQSQRASSLVQSVQQLKLDGDAAAAISPAEKLEIVECDLEKQAQEGLVAAIGNASLVVCSIGASEKEILDVTGPYRIDYMATNNLVQAAAAAKVEHFVLVTSLGTNRVGFPAFLLNLFWGVLCWKRRAEEALIASGIPYTIIRPGGMERPTDAFKETHNLVVAAEDTYVGGLVSNLQVAELIGCVANNRRAAYCKVVEVIAETTAPLLPMEQLLSTVPSKREPPPVSATTEDVVQVKSEPKAGPPPAPTAAAGEAAKASAPARPLSPYTAYEGLKPPSSPSPTPSSGSSDAVSNIKKPQEAAADAASPLLPTSSRPLSPYTAFVDLKPPSSPSPSSPSSPSATADDGGSTSTTASSSLQSASDSSSDNGLPGSSDAPEPLQEENQKQQQTPLSPYTRYEDLKPPSSPTPSAPKT